MSRIGMQPIDLPGTVSVTVGEGTVRVKGPRGETTVACPAGIRVSRDGATLNVSRTGDEVHLRALHGTLRSLLANAVKGVDQGFSRSLEITGVGYRVAQDGRDLVLSLGLSHPIRFPVPEGIDVQIGGQTALTLSGIDKHLVGQVAARLRGFAPAEPYKGKGVRYKNEKIRRKVGKAVA